MTLVFYLLLLPHTDLVTLNLHLAIFCSITVGYILGSTEV